MTFWLDAHLDPELAPRLGANFQVIAKSLDEIGLRDPDDDVLFEAAKRFGQIVIVTKDSAFVAMVQRPGPPPLAPWISFGNMPTVQIHAKLSKTLADALDLLRAGDPLVEIA